MKKKVKRIRGGELVKVGPPSVSRAPVAGGDGHTAAAIDPFIAMIERAARDPAVDINKMKELLAMRDKERAQASITAFVLAMVDAQMKMEPVRKDCTNPQTSSKYASYYALDKAIRPLYSGNGFALTFGTEPTSSEFTRVICDVMHSGGYVKRYQKDMPIVTKGPQGKDVMTLTHASVSADTYAMRDLLRMIFNIATTDDDGNAAGIGEKISDEQLVELGALVEATKANVPVLCEMLGVDVLANLPKSRFLEARAALIAKQKQQQKKQGAA